MAGARSGRPPQDRVRPVQHQPELEVDAGVHVALLAEPEECGGECSRELRQQPVAQGLGAVEPAVLLPKSVERPELGVGVEVTHAVDRDGGRVELHPVGVGHVERDDEAGPALAQHAVHLGEELHVAIALEVLV